VKPGGTGFKPGMAGRIRLVWAHYNIAIVFIIFAFICCAHAPPTESWKKQCSYLQQPRPQNRTITEADYYILFLIAAYHLDYLDNRALIDSLIDYGRRKGDIGHAWVYLKGIKDGGPDILCFNPVHGIQIVKEYFNSI